MKPGLVIFATVNDRAAILSKWMPECYSCGAPPGFHFYWCQIWRDHKTAREMREQAVARQEARDRTGAQYGDSND